MNLRDRVEGILRAWDRHETGRGAQPIIDYDCHPESAGPLAPIGRLDVLTALDELREGGTDADEPQLVVSIAAHQAYVRALLGERLPLDEYVRRSLGCRGVGWSTDHLDEVGAIAREHVTGLGIAWNADTETELEEAETRLDIDAVPDEIRQAADEFEPVVRTLTDTTATYALTIEAADVDAYWSYWLDGAGDQVRLRLNLRNANFTSVRARQFALHEILGHALQSASYAQRCATEDVPWIRLLAVHAQHQVMLEGLAQAMPLFVAPDDRALVARVRLDHYVQLVLAELHVSINIGDSIETCANRARARIPYWSTDRIADSLSDRATNPTLCTYLWAYPAGLDWFVALADRGTTVAVQEVFRAAYRDPLTPAELGAFWPAGPAIGGP